jgi:3-oxo-5-alpha-steroid 4-dehydrogenase 1
MTDLYKLSYLLIFGFAVVVFVLLFFVSAPYGKFSRKGWGPNVKSKWAWLLMEFPSPFLMTLFFILSPQKDVPQFIFITFWLGHYIHRTFIYPFTQSGSEKPYPLILVSMAFVFNLLNGYANGYGTFRHVVFSFSWIMSWKFTLGFFVFIAGFVINKMADEKFRKMRIGNPEKYVMPKGWLFNYISSPHYFGEILEWTGWAFMTWTLPGFAFAVFTFANLFPRAWASHQYYKANFPDYPENRKAVIPFII